MSAVLLDTHAWAWSLSRDSRLTRAALNVVEAADVVWLSPISFFEIGQKCRLGKWPQMAPFANGLAALLDAQGGKIAAVGSAIATRAANLDWTHRDPFDRLIAATAIELKVELVSADAEFDALAADTAWRRRVW